MASKRQTRSALSRYGRAKSKYDRQFHRFAGLAVIFCHALHWFPGIVPGGYLGVVTSFLVLSGYLVTSGLYPIITGMDD